MGYQFLEGADKNNHGYVLSNLQEQFSMETNQYPSSLSKAINMLSYHHIDPEYYENKKRREQLSKLSRDIPKLASFTQKKLDLTCYCCGKKRSHN